MRASGCTKYCGSRTARAVLIQFLSVVIAIPLGESPHTRFASLSFLLYPPIAQGHIAEAAAQKYIHCISRPVHDRLAMQVERRVQENPFACSRFVLCQKAVIFAGVLLEN